MPTTQQRGNKEGETEAPDVRKVMSHPWRVRIMEALGTRDMSCSQIVDERLIPELQSKPRHDAISNLAYHFRLLLRAGLIEVVDSVPRRGSFEQICRAPKGSHHSTEEWASLSQEERSAITPVTLSSFTGLADAAIAFETFDNRIDRHLSYLPLDLDEQAWSELGPVLDGVLALVSRVRQEAAERLEKSGERPIRATWGQMLFESPPLPASTRS